MNAAVNQGGALYVGDQLVILQKNTFMANQAGKGGAIFTSEYSYADFADTGKYQSLQIDAETSFTGNVATIFSLPPTNYAEFNNLQFKSYSTLADEVHGVASLLNNYDINYLHPQSLKLVSFLANGGVFSDGSSSSKDLQCTENETINLLSAPSRIGHEFMGWKLSNLNGVAPGTSYPASVSYTVTDHTVFTAQWRKTAMSKADEIIRVERSKDEASEPIIRRNIIKKGTVGKTGEQSQNGAIFAYLLLVLAFAMTVPQTRKLGNN